MALGRISYDHGKATNRADEELGNVGERGVPPRGQCITCGGEAESWQCDECSERAEALRRMLKDSRPV